MRLVLKADVYLPQLDRALKSSGISFVQDTSTGEWSPAFVARGRLTLSLRGLTFVSPGVLAELVIVLQACGTQGMPIYVEMPVATPAATFLANARFVEVLRDGPDGPLEVVVDREVEPSTSYRTMLPLRWIEDMNLENWLLHVLDRADSGGRRLLRGTARDVTGIVLGELVENVYEHSGVGRALVGAWSREETPRSKPEHALSTERRAFERNERDHDEEVELVVADGGFGVMFTLADAGTTKTRSELLAYAFDRWATRFPGLARAGTRGLYRVARLARRNSGLVTLRSGAATATAAVSVDPVTQADARADDGPGIPGTVLVLRMPRLEERSRDRATISTELVPSDVRVVVTSPEEIDKELLESVFQRPYDGRSTVLFVVEPPDGFGHREAVELVHRIAREAHPRRVAVAGLGLSYEALREVAYDVLAPTDPGAEQLGPVLLIGNDILGGVWAGLPIEDADALANGENIPISGAAVDWVTARVNSQWLLPNVPGELVLGLKERYHRRLEGVKMTPRDGHGFVTRSLSHVTGWFDVPRFLRSVAPEAPVLRTLLREALLEFVPPDRTASLQVLAEATVPEVIATSLAAAMSADSYGSRVLVERVRREDVLAARPTTLDRRREVVILVNAVSEGASARRLVGYALRQGLTVLGVVAIVDARAAKGPVRVWRRDFPVASLIWESLKPTPGAEPTEFQFLDASGHIETEPEQVDVSLDSDRAITRFRDAPGSLLLGHFEGVSGRHLTFALSPLAVAANGPLVRTFAQDVTKQPLELVKSWDGVQVVHEDDRREPSLSAALAREVARAIGIPSDVVPLSQLADGPNSSQPPRHVLHVAWSSLSGASIWSAILGHARAGAEGIVVVILFSQLEPHVEEELTSVRSVSGRGHARVEVRVLIISRLPISAFTPEACPMCGQARRSLHGRAALRESAETSRERERFAPIDSSTARPFGDYADMIGRQYEQPSDSIVAAALHARAALRDASRSTRRANEVREAWEGKLEDEMNPLLVGLATLIAAEPQWLREPPLSSTEFRASVSGALEKRISSLPKDGDSGTYARLLIALRVVSKDGFVDALGALFAALMESPSRLPLLQHLIMNLLESDYVGATGLLPVLRQQLGDALEAARRTKADSTTIGALRDLVYEANDHYERGELAKRTTVDLVAELQNAVRQFSTHDIWSLLVRSVPADGALANLLAAQTCWREIRDAAGGAVMPIMRELRSYLEQTSSLRDDPRLAELLGAKDGGAPRPIIEQAIGDFDRAVREAGHHNAEESALRACGTAKIAREVMEYIFFTAENSGPPGTRIEKAAGFAALAARSIGDRARRQAKEQGLEAEFRVEETPVGIKRLPIPDDFYRLVVDAVLANAKDHNLNVTSIQLSIEPRADGVVEVRFRSEGIARARAREVGTPLGHLTGITMREPRGIKVVMARDGDAFLTRIVIDPKRRSPNA